MNKNEDEVVITANEMLELYLKNLLTLKRIRKELKEWIDVLDFTDIRSEVIDSEWNTEEELREVLETAICNSLNEKVSEIANHVSNCLLVEITEEKDEDYEED